MGAYADMDEKLAGLKFGFPSRDESYVVKETLGIEAGYPVFGYAGDIDSAYLFHQDQDTVVFDADFVTSNVIDGTINGVAITQVPFNTDHDTTIGDLVTEILTNADVTSATLTDVAGDNRTIRIITKGQACVTTFTVTLGATQAVATITSAASAGLTYLGVSRFEQRESAGANLWRLNEVIPVMTQGGITCVTGETVQANTTAYVRTDGTFGTSGVSTSGVFKEDVTGAGLARLYVGGENG